MDQLLNSSSDVFVAQEGLDQPYDGSLPTHQEQEEQVLDEEYSDYDTDDSLDDELKLINAQLQWEESLDQLKTLVGFVILPLIGKMLGRRFAGFREYISMEFYRNYICTNTTLVWRKAMDTFY